MRRLLPRPFARRALVSLASARAIPRRLAFGLAAFVASSLLVASTAAAQSFGGDVPRGAAPTVWSAPNAGQTCAGTVTTRAFNTFTFQVATAGSYTFTATRDAGTGVALHLYQGSFDPAFPCVNSLGVGSVSSTGTTMLTSSLASGTHVLVVSGASSIDFTSMTLNVTGPASVTANCSASRLTPSSITNVASTGTTVQVIYEPAFGCSSFTTSGVPIWISGVPSSGSGLTGIDVVVATNGSASARNATITIGAQSLFVSQLGLVCSYALAPTSVNVPATGAIESFAVSAGGGCSWGVSTSVGWITAVTPTSGSGSATVNFTVQANTGPARSGTLTVGGQTFTVNQADGCTTTVTPSSTTAGAGGSTDVPLMIDMSNAACPWSITQASAGLSGFTATSGTGDLAIDFDVLPNPGIARQLTFQVNGQLVTIQQAGACTFSVTPNSLIVGAGLGNGAVTVTASGPGCTFDAVSNAAFLTNVNPTSGTGTMDVLFDVAANSGPARMGTLTIAGQTVTVSQASGCTYSVSPTYVAPPSGGSTNASVVVTTAAGCPWTAASNAAFVTGVTPANGTGTSAVSFDVAANLDPPRSGTLTVAGTTVTIDQAGGCSYLLSESSLSFPETGAVGASVSLTTGALCPFAVSAPATIVRNTSPTGGTGPATITFDVDPNPGPARSTELFVSGQRLEILQADGCTYALSLSSPNVGPSAGATSVNVDASDAACTFGLSSSETFAPLSVATATGDQSYSVNVSANSGGARTVTFTLSAPNGVSANVVLTQAAVGAPSIVMQPESLTVGLAQSFTLQVTTSGTVDSWQWYRDGDAIPGATSASYTVAAAALADEGDYTVVVTNASGMVQSEIATVTVTGGPDDAGIPDAGTDASTPDAGSDAGMQPDGGSTSSGAEGCACSTGGQTGGSLPTGAWLPLAAFALAVLRRRATRSRA